MISNYEKKKTNIIISENKMLRGVFGPMKNKVSGKNSELGNKELNDLYIQDYLCTKIKIFIKTGTYRLDWKTRNSYRILVGKLLLRPSRKWEVGINF